MKGTNLRCPAVTTESSCGWVPTGSDRAGQDPKLYSAKTHWLCKEGGQGTNRCRDKSSGWCHGFSFLSTYTRQESSCHGLLSAYRKVLYFIPSICRRQRPKYDERLREELHERLLLLHERLYVFPVFESYR